VWSERRISHHENAAALAWSHWLHRRLNETDVLTYSLDQRHQATVRRHYLQWRKRHDQPIRCDNPNCPLHSGEAVWNGTRINLVLDHVDGCPYHNRSENLRLLCPNCNSQLETHGGRNRGRIQNRTRDGFQIAYRNSTRRDATIFVTGFRLGLTVGNLTPVTVPDKVPD
jgi:hypothetical protein